MPGKAQSNNALSNADLKRSADCLSRALDEENYEAVNAMLAPDCRYNTGTETLCGPDAIVASYRNQSALARKLFEHVEYCSAVTIIADDTVSIVFSDRLLTNRKEHVYKCRQSFHFRPDGLIDAITHDELPGEREGLLQFCTICGVKLDRPAAG